MKDGLKHFAGFTELTEKVKKIIRRVKKSAVTRDELKELQESLDMPAHILIEVILILFVCKRSQKSLTSKESLLI